LREVRVSALTNASVEIGDEVIRSAGGVVKLGNGVETLHFYVQRMTAGQAYSASLLIKDECGEWPAVVSAGP
jgi:hypothetical protein